MPSWKKIIVSGSDAHLNNITASAGIDVSGNITGSNLSTASFGAFIGDGSQLTGITATNVNIDGLAALGGTGLHQTQDHFIFSDNGEEKKITFSNLQDAIFAGVSGDATVAAGGALTIANGSVDNDMLAGSIAASKLAGSIGNDKLSNDGITIAGQDISLGGTITANTIAGQIGNDTISGNQIEGGTIGSTTITTLAATDVTIGGTLTVNGTLTYISSSNLRVQDSFAFLATGSAGTNVDAGIIAQSGSTDLTGSALYHDTSDKRWSVATQVASNATAVTPLQYVSTVKVSDLEASLNDNKTYTGSVDYGKGEMVVDADGEIFIYT